MHGYLEDEKNIYALFLVIGDHAMFLNFIVIHKKSMKN